MMRPAEDGTNAESARSLAMSWKDSSATPLAGVVMMAYILRTRTEGEFIVQWEGAAMGESRLHQLQKEEPRSLPTYRYLVEHGGPRAVAKAAARIAVVGSAKIDVPILEKALRRAPCRDCQSSPGRCRIEPRRLVRHRDRRGWHGHRDAPRCGGHNLRVQRSCLCPGDRHPGQLQESDGAGRNHPARVSLQPAGRHRSHRPRRRSCRPPDRPLLEDPAPAGALPGPVTCG